MCGIAGYLTTDAAPKPGGLEAMLKAIARRGPDSEGRAEWPGVQLGHRRLAILDLSPAGHQPMLSEDGQVGLVFNGCIYNFLALRTELEACGHRFHSQCDTEVLLRGYLEWGAEKLAPRLHGMFAFAVWDQRSGKLYLVRDRMGVKPLLYCQRGRDFAFGSTLRALRVAGCGEDIDPMAMLEFLEYGYITDQRSIYSGIQKLLPGHLLEWHDGRIATKRYWTLPETDERSAIGFDEAVEETERLLVEAVRLRLQADVPIAALLSGGIDSALVCWAMKKLNANVTAFTVGSPGNAEDESEGARFTARVLDIPHQVITLSGRDDLELDPFFEAFSEPFSCQSAFGMLAVSRAIKPYGTVLLTGDGADDVYLGYPHFLNAWRAQNAAHWLPSFATPLWGALRRAIPNVAPLQRGVSFLDYATGGIGAYIRRRDGLDYLFDHGIPGAKLRSLDAPWRGIPASAGAARRLFHDAFQYHWDTHFTGEFMPKVDGGTMHYGLEARAPFLDQKLWEFAATLPVGLRLRGGHMKAILREIVKRRISPEVGSRPKQGFTVPISAWMAREMKHLWEPLRSDSILARQGWVDGNALRSTIDDALRRERIAPSLWNLFILEHWMLRQQSR